MNQVASKLDFFNLREEYVRKVKNRIISWHAMSFSLAGN